MSAAGRIGIVALASLGWCWGGPALAAAGNDAAALLAYNLAGQSSLAAGRRYLILPRETEARGRCVDGFTCNARRLRIRLLRGDIVAGRTTRLTLRWSADRDDVWEREVGFSANDVRHIAWLRPSADGGGRRLVLDVPATAVRRYRGLAITITVATRAKEGKVPDDGVDGLELELLP